MKKLFTALFCIISLNGLTQTPKWFVSVATGLNIGGPSISIQSQMKQQGYNDEVTYIWFGGGTTKYPIKNPIPSLLLTGGKQISEKKSLFFVVGLLDKATVIGRYANDINGYVNNSPDFELNPEIRYSIYQVAGGFMYTNPKSRTKIGIGPSFYLINFTHGAEKGTGFTAGITATSRTPFKKKIKPVRLEFITAINLAPPVKMEINQGKNANHFKMKSANMISINLGVGISFNKN